MDVHMHYHVGSNKDSCDGKRADRGFVMHCLIVPCQSLAKPCLWCIRTFSMGPADSRVRCVVLYRCGLQSTRGLLQTWIAVGRALRNVVTVVHYSRGVWK